MNWGKQPDRRGAFVPFCCWERRPLAYFTAGKTGGGAKCARFVVFSAKCRARCRFGQGFSFPNAKINEKYVLLCLLNTHFVYSFSSNHNFNIYIFSLDVTKYRRTKACNECEQRCKVVQAKLGNLTLQQTNVVEHCGMDL